MSNRLEKLQEEYFEFCLGLLQKMPQGEIDLEETAKQAYMIRDELKLEISKIWTSEVQDQSISAVRLEIEKLRAEIEGKNHNT